MAQHGFDSFRGFHQWSYENPADFWQSAWSDLGIVGQMGEQPTVIRDFLDTEWFPDAKLNVVNTLLAGDDQDEVMVSHTENSPRRSLLRGELKKEVAACAAALMASGVKQGDRVAAWMPNVPETMIFALGALSIGAIVSTASTDFGPAALVDRFGQIEPTVLFAASQYSYGGKEFDLENKLDEVLTQLPSVKTTVVIGSQPGYLSWDEWLEPHRGVPLTPVALPFSHPGFILFSSGTTGKPKCIVHSAAGVLLKVLSEQGHQLDVHQGDRICYATTCGWMMWNWLMMGLGRGATIVLVDGSPGYPDLDRLWSIAEQEHLSLLGVSAALIDTWRQENLTPGSTHNLHALRTVASTGSPLAANGFDWVKDSVSETVNVVSIAGGTDLCGCLVLGVPTEPVPRGEIQGPALGMDVTVLRSDGTLAEIDEDGELVCRTPFPSVPLYFWGDKDGERMRSAYFNRFPSIWAHGDFARRTQSGGFEILGRLDATLNAKGVRIGTAEIYRVVLAVPGVTGAMAIAQPEGNDSRIVLFVVTNHGLSKDTEETIRRELRQQASPRHVPAVIAEAPDLPRTRSGKLTELIVTDILAGREVRDASSLANPECLEWFSSWAKTHPAT